MAEALAHDLARAVAAHGADLVHLRGVVVERHGGEVDAGDLARALHARLDHVALGGRRAERLRGAVELALLHLGPLELHEDPLVLDRAHGVAARLLDERLLARA